MSIFFNLAGEPILLLEMWGPWLPLAVTQRVSQFFWLILSKTRRTIPSFPPLMPNWAGKHQAAHIKKTQWVSFMLLLCLSRKKKKKSLCNLLICHDQKMHNAIAINTSGSTQGKKKGARLEGGHLLTTLHGSSLRLMYKLEVLNRLDLFLGFFSHPSCHPLPPSIKKNKKLCNKNISRAQC